MALILNNQKKKIKFLEVLVLLWKVKISLDKTLYMKYLFKIEC